MIGYQTTFVTASISPIFQKSEAAKSTKEKYVFPKFDNISPDLQQVNIVLASEHENINGDYFPRSEMILAAKTPFYKPFNVEHTLSEDESYISQPYFNRTKNTIIGNMIFSSLATKDGKVLTDDEIAKLDSSDDPKRDKKDSIDLVASAVLYSAYFPKTVSDIEKSSKEGKMFVSMECWFRSYDFLVNGEIIKSTPSNMKELTERWEKSEKTKDGRRISRVLRNVIFGGVAATPNPANPSSVFLAVASLEQEYAHLVKRHRELHILYNSEKKEEYKFEHDAIEKSVASIAGKIKELKNE